MAPGSGKRQIVWSQGQILPPEAALAVQMIEAEKAATHFPIVISHDCDLAVHVHHLLTFGGLIDPDENSHAPAGALQDGTRITALDD